MTSISKYLMPIITIICLSVAIIALRYAYNCLPNLRIYLIMGICVVIIYLAITLWITHQTQGTQKLLFHCLTLQVIPVCLTIGTFIIVPQIGTRVYGKINNAELTFNDLQSKQIVSAQKLGITPLKARRDVAVYLGQSELDKKLIKISSNSLYYVSFKTDVLHPKNNTELREALSQAVYNMRKQDRCYVKFENNQKCYHITVR